MGSYRSQPQTTKTSSQMCSLDHSYASVNMCGWRRYMEDASLIISPFTYRNFWLFAVFDGHGGPEVALFAKNKFPTELQRNQNLRKGKFKEALKQTFLKMDTLLMSEKGKRQIEQIRKQEVGKQFRWCLNEQDRMHFVSCFDHKIVCLCCKCWRLSSCGFYIQKIMEIVKQ